MKKTIKYITALIIASSGVLSAAAVELSANTTPIQDATVKIEASHDALLIIEDSAIITDSEKAEKTVEARKDIIRDAITLALAEIDNLQTGLEDLPEFTKESIESRLQEKFLKELDAYLEYYDDKSKEIEKLIVAEEIKTFAKEIIDYRTNIYNPAIEKMAEFQLIFYTEETINIATSRLTKMLVDIKKLEKLNLFNLDLVSAKLDQAMKLLETAAGKYEKARELILREDAPKIVAPEVIENIIDAEPVGIVVKLEVEAPTAKELIESSLTDIKSTYDIFIQISRDIRKSLGLR